MFHSRLFRSVIILIVALVFASTAYALAASNTVDASKAGDGNSGITGYDVTGVSYNLGATDPSLLASVEFDLDAAASSVAASLTNTATSTETFASGCTEGPADHWTCTFGTVSALSADSFRVISAQ